MGVSINTRQAYSEVDEFLGLLSNEQRNKIPQKLRNFFTEEKDQSYKKEINPQIPIKEQNLKEETLGIIALLNLEYWCENETEKQRLKQVYAKNEENYQKALQEKYNPDNLFKNKHSEISNELTENTQLVAIQQYPWYKRLYQKILAIFGIRKAQ